MARRFATLLIVLLVLLCASARADMRGDAERLLARRVRQTGVDPKNIAIRDVVVVRDQAVLSWDSGKQHGLMGLMVKEGRWWDVYDGPAGAVSLRAAGFTDALVSAALAGNADVRASALASRSLARPAAHGDPFCFDICGVVQPNGSTVFALPSKTAGYQITLQFSANDAPAWIPVTQLYARAPTHAEFAPPQPPAPGWGGPDAVCFFDVGIGGSRAVTFRNGTTIDVWFPFVLDDQLRYNVSFVSAGKPSGMIFGTIFDNTLHFVLPAFTIDPNAPLMAEIDGDVKGST
jgi:hypothetical protein